MIYPIKYLDYEKKYDIDFLSFKDKMDLSKYDYIIYENNMQKVSSDVNEDEYCKALYLNNRKIAKLCFLNEENFKKRGFMLYNKVYYKADKFLETKGSDSNSTYFTLKRM